MARKEENRGDVGRAGAHGVCSIVSMPPKETCCHVGASAAALASPPSEPQNLLSMKPRNGARWSGSQASRRTNLRLPLARAWKIAAIFHDTENGFSFASRAAGALPMFCGVKKR